MELAIRFIFKNQKVYDFVFEENHLFELLDCIKKGKIFKDPTPNKISYIWVDKTSVAAYGISVAPPVKKTPDTEILKTKKDGKKCS